MQKDIFGEIFEAGYTIVNHDMVKKLDLVTAYWLCEIMSWMKYLRKRKRLDEDGWFYYTQEHIEKKIGVSSQRQNRIIKKLKSIRVMRVKRRGSPPRNYFKIDYEKLVIFLYGDSPKSINLIDTNLLKQEDYYNSKDNSIYSTRFKKSCGSPLYFERNKNVRPSYYRFADQFQDKQIDNHPSKYKQYSPSQLANQIKNGGEVIDKLIRLDKWDFCKDIKPAINWAIKGESKFTNIFDGWEMWKKNKNKKPTKKKFNEDPRNPSRKVMRRGPDGYMHGVWEN
jgi:predicted DNA-binding ArsR family transcriptional regulator